jgi:hypothetical protein
MDSMPVEQKVFNELVDTLATLRVNKPEQRSESARSWAVAITEMEKVVAYFKVYVLEFGVGTQRDHDNG